MRSVPFCVCSLRTSACCRLPSVSPIWVLVEWRVKSNGRADLGPEVLARLYVWPSVVWCGVLIGGVSVFLLRGGWFCICEEIHSTDKMDSFSTS
ncbi:hypothetical protein DL98DRAFT_70543 [Cadophora sp. DSE1049]|nr:hypothetical protein DL98DRAFT_70543 [Cadophora sp. DSE1049]